MVLFVVWQVMSAVSGEDALCLCEYDDVEGQRQHLLATCCDCDALDVACDRCSLLQYFVVSVKHRSNFQWDGGFGTPRFRVGWTPHFINTPRACSPHFSDQSYAPGVKGAMLLHWWIKQVEASLMFHSMCM